MPDIYRFSLLRFRTRDAIFVFLYRRFPSMPLLGHGRFTTTLYGPNRATTLVVEHRVVELIEGAFDPDQREELIHGSRECAAQGT